MKLKLLFFASFFLFLFIPALPNVIQNTQPQESHKPTVHTTIDEFGNSNISVTSLIGKLELQLNISDLLYNIDSSSQMIQISSSISSPVLVKLIKCLKPLFGKYFEKSESVYLGTEYIQVLSEETLYHFARTRPNDFDTDSESRKNQCFKEDYDIDVSLESTTGSAIDMSISFKVVPRIALLPPDAPSIMDWVRIQNRQEYRANFQQFFADYEKKGVHGKMGIFFKNFVSDAVVFSKCGVNVTVKANKQEIMGIDDLLATQLQLLDNIHCESEPHLGSLTLHLETSSSTEGCFRVGNIIKTMEKKETWKIVLTLSFVFLFFVPFIISMMAYTDYKAKKVIEKKCIYEPLSQQFHDLRWNKALKEGAPPRITTSEEQRRLPDLPAEAFLLKKSDVLSNPCYELDENESENIYEEIPDSYFENLERENLARKQELNRNGPSTSTWTDDDYASIRLQRVETPSPTPSDASNVSGEVKLSMKPLQSGK